MRSKSPNNKKLLLVIAELQGQLAEAQRSLHDFRTGHGNGKPESERKPANTVGTLPETPAKEYFPSASGGDSYGKSDGYLRLYHQVIVNAKEGIAIQDANGRIIEQNAAHRSLLGYPDEELVGKTPGYYLEGGRDEFGRTMDDLLQWGSYSGEARCRARSGRLIDAELSAVIIRDEAGGIVGYATLVHDVTEKRRMEAALRESEERFAAFMNSSSVVASMRDVKGHYVYVNRAYEELVGKRSGEILGRTCFEIWPSEIAKELAAADQHVLAAGHALELHEKTALPGREAKEWLAIRFPFRDRRNRAYVGGVSIDITERKSLEEQLRQSQKMEAVGRLAGGVAHDFNNLLTIITGYSELLLNSPDIEEERRNKIEEIRKAGERAALLTRQLLAFSRKQVLAPRILDLNAVVENLRKMIDRLIGEDIDFMTIPHTPLNMVKADPGQVDQILMNLVVNARDAMPHGGRLTIETANVEFDEEYARSHLPSLPGQYVMIAVSDTGTGMDPDTQRHIFEPFFTTKETGKGTGLGLAMVYGIVKQSGGFIWVYSEQGVGTVFKVYLPRADDLRELRSHSAEEPGLLRGTETILVAEDEAGLRTLIRETLGRHGYKVLEAGDGKEAVMVSTKYEEPIDLLIADVVMPQMSGRELAERVTTARPETRVLYISGYTDDAIVQHGVIDPNTDFLQKPFTPSALARKVRSIFSQPSDKQT
jgi:two-component system cell cycle sensor histidine kinase/response regulator CckA